MYSIGIEDLVSNAFIESLNKHNTHFIAYREIEEYGSCVVKVLEGAGERVRLTLSRNRTSNFLNEYSDLFKEDSVDGKLGIQLKRDIRLNELIKEFRGHLPLPILLAFTNEEAVSVL